MTAIANQSPLPTRRVLAVLVVAVILLFSASCKTTYEYDKKRMVIFTFGVGLTLISDKEAEVNAETKDSNGTGDKGVN